MTKMFSYDEMTKLMDVQHKSIMEFESNKRKIYKSGLTKCWEECDEKSKALVEASMALNDKTKLLAEKTIYLDKKFKDMTDKILKLEERLEFHEEL